MTAKKILIVDDSEAVRRQVEDLLVPAGYTVLHACDGVEGFERARECSDLLLIISDINMPRLTGLAMLTQLKAAGSTVPAMMLTTEIAGAMIQQAKENGVRSWVVKPFRPELFRAAVDLLISACQGKPRRQP